MTTTNTTTTQLVTNIFPGLHFLPSLFPSPLAEHVAGPCNEGRGGGRRGEAGTAQYRRCTINMTRI
ncbi:hypothetical protein E2C01_010595 [Portunus trituberculatus]|uniref:Uncharacterized protein n=1 Tax=Portunus trituberculatus TaxID=210409 RepID=A0A5B7D8V6_PORTR|nr:hypothetical protein [Portunus trituberculatus]